MSNFRNLILTLYPLRRSCRMAAQYMCSGEWPGHCGHNRELYPTDEVAEHIDLHPEIWSDLGTIFEDISVSIEYYQVTDLLEISPDVTQF